jgi:transposase-like protein
MKEKRSRRQFTNEEKAAILSRHLVDKIPVSDLCEEHHLRPSLLYLWQRQALENLGAALESGVRDRRSGREEALTKTVEQLKADLVAWEARLAKKDRVIAEVTAEYGQLNNELGEP